VESLLKGSENPHFMDVKPSFIQRVAHADILCVVGLELEIGWIPKVISKSGNKQVHPGEKGYCNFGEILEHKNLVLEKPFGPIDRSMGDIHAHGNPHFWLDPKLLAIGSQAVLQSLKALDPQNSLTYETNYKAFSDTLTTLHQKLSAKLTYALLKRKDTNITFIDYHKDFSYFAKSYGLNPFGSIEEKPGVSPSAGRIAQVAQQAKQAGVLFALASLHSPQKVTEKFSEVSKIPVLRTSTSILLNQKDFDSYEKIQNKLVENIIVFLSSGVNKD
ncbi:MAG: metal ABC transporter substrate-binding protein, partial [Silvanigrellaceae bacterium]|nr:metal ABC transporter substrate-binding protein [Silvanigrellaceae bacterium]